MVRSEICFVSSKSVLLTLANIDIVYLVCCQQFRSSGTPAVHFLNILQHQIIGLSAVAVAHDPKLKSQHDRLSSEAQDWLVVVLTGQKQ